MKSYIFANRHFIMFYGFTAILGLLFTSCSQSPSSVQVSTSTPDSQSNSSQAMSPQFEFLTPNSNDTYKAGDRIIANGTHNLAPDTFGWIFLKDTYGGYYLQSPAIEFFSDGTWEATNIRLGTEIVSIIAISVDGDGNDAIKRWVGVSRFGKIDPDEIKNLSGYLELGRVNIVEKK